MGNYVIAVHGTGCHHNGAEYDADQIAAKLVDELKAKGHSITAATITSGSTQDLLSTSSRFALKSAG